MTIKVNPWVASLDPYVPGEQPRGEGFIKLNTNESPYPPAPAVLEAMRAVAAAGQNNKYPDPASISLRESIAHDLQVETGQIIAGNGSDETLRLLCQAFLDSSRGDKIGTLNPTYVLYATLAAMFGCGAKTFQTDAPDYKIPAEAINSKVKIFFLANPNPPLGTWYSPAEVEQLVAADPTRLVIIDEAYVDFSIGNSLQLLQRHENVVITRTFSKSYSLAGMRVGFAIASRGIISELEKIKDSYNLNRMSQAAAEAAWKAVPYYRDMADRIKADRDFLRTALVSRGFEVPNSRGNFVFARRSDAQELYATLKAAKILVRYFDMPGLRDGVRITIGTREELDALLGALDEIQSRTAATPGVLGA